MTDQPAMVTAAREIHEAAEEAGIAVRLLGGTAIWLRAPDDVRSALTREFADVDLVTVRSDTARLRDLLVQLGYVPDKMFNATQGTRRLYFTARDGSFHVDIFVDRFVMSHELEFAERLRIEPITLPAAELLLTKLQIAELNHKDAADTILLLLSHRLSDTDGPRELNTAHVTALCADDWGLYTTVSDNLGKTADLVDAIVPGDESRVTARSQIESLLQLLRDAPKTRRWRRRARVGRRVRWYETPDEV